MVDKKTILDLFQTIKTNCTGCAACVNVCPKHAINMESNNKGFDYPVINDLCIKCGLCASVCPEMNKHICKVIPMDYYGATLKDQSRARYSASGGVFASLADKILDSHGVVVGAVLINSREVIHTIARTSDEKIKICGSKYVQSEIREVFKDIKKLLNKSVIVLFSGTPCQVAGLKAYLGSDFENLFTVDILCHGVSSKGVFQQYVDILEKKHGRIKQYIFRDRTLGMKGSNVRVVFENGEECINTPEVNCFDRLYSRGYLMRESCYNCKYAEQYRVADITIGDFWGIESVKLDWNLNNGASLVSVNTLKGKIMWSQISEELLLFITDFDHCKQASMERPVKKPDNIAFFWEKYRAKGFTYCADLFCGYSKKSRIYFTLQKIQRRLKRKKR